MHFGTAILKHVLTQVYKGYCYWNV